MELSRNDPCPCGSGKKYKRCCLLLEQQNLTGTSPRLMQALQLYEAEQFEAAEKIYRSILTDVPSNPDALHYLGLIEFRHGDFAASVRHISLAITSKPSVAHFHCNLGNSLKQLGQKNKAEAAYRKALRLDPNLTLGLVNFGSFLLSERRSHEAIDLLLKAVKIDPNHAFAWYALGQAWYEEENIDSAAQCYRQAVALNADFTDAQINLANILIRFGDCRDAIQHLQEALRINPNNLYAYQSYLAALNYDFFPNEDVLQAHQNWAAQFLSRIEPLPERPPSLTKPTTQRIKIGYLSPDFRRHAMRFFVRHIFKYHDRNRFEVFCYSLAGREDDESVRLKALADHWLPCASLDDRALAQHIRDDGIDVLVDLAGHTAGNKLLALAYKPAPVQVTMLGYMNTSGMKAIGYRVSDSIACPPNMEAFFSEKILRMPNSQWCYMPDENIPDCVPAPCISSNEFIFGAFHNTAKMNDTLLAAWCEILRRVPQGKLLTVAWGKEAGQRLKTYLVDAGILDNRLVILEPKPYTQYLCYYQLADLTLDTFPYAGGTVSCESLWMGVPFITYAAPTPGGNGGASILVAAGLKQLIANSIEEYIDLAVTLANNKDALVTIRTNLRQNIESSPLADGVRYTHELENLFTAALAAIPY
ncbi:MAG: tetratricopeptide repeat protein [Gallionellaceae bacterium]|nr:tetratricopeptide repeat protein [Gallionellaceae bacterium]